MASREPRPWPGLALVTALLAVGAAGLLVLGCSAELPRDAPTAAADVPTATVPSTVTSAAPPVPSPTPTVVSPTATTAPTATPPAKATATPAPAAATPTATARATAAARTSPAPKPAAGQTERRVLLGYYVPYDPTSWASFRAQAENLDYVAAQWVTVDACGNLGSRDDRTLIAYASERGVRVLPSLLTSSGWLNHQLLTDPETSEHFLNQIVEYVDEMGYPGFDLDLEGIDAGDRDAYSAFVAKLSMALHGRGKILTLAIPAKTADVRTGWAGPYDYAALGEHADLVLLMAYEYSWSGGPPGSIAPQTWVERVAAYAVSQMPPRKILIGLAFYGYDWNVTLGGRARALTYPQAAALAQHYGARITVDGASQSGTFGYTARAGDVVPALPAVPAPRHDIAVRAPAECSVKQPTPTPAAGPVPTPRPTPVPPLVQEHVVWLEDAASTAARLEIVRRHGVGGVGTWRIGQEDPTVWPHLAEFRSGQ